jgi:ABC-type lipoprotein release transport system permease subunit
MTLLRIAWRNLWRHRRRTLITASGMAIAMGLVISMSAMQDGMFEMMADVMIRQQLGHVQVNHPDWAGRRQMYDTVPENLVERIQALPEATGASGRMFSFGLAASETTSGGARYVGIDPKDDLVITDLSLNRVRGEFLAEEPAGQVVIGEAMARELGLNPGDELVFLGQAADGSMANELLKVVGTYSTGIDQMDKSGAYMHLADLQRILALEDQVHQILVVGEGLDASAELAAAVAAIAAEDGAQVRSWQEADPAMAKMMGMQDASLFIMLFILFSVAGLAVLNTNLMTVFERTRELGVLRAIGLTRTKMMLLVILESVLLTAVATVFGLLLAGFLDWLLVEYGFPYETAEGKGFSWQGVTFPTRFYGSIRPFPFVVTTVFVFFVAIGAAIWPALRAALLRPVQAMREV